MVETYEENIEDWYKNERDKVSLTDFLCERVILTNDDKSKSITAFTKQFLKIF
jgi:hypothetical protein